MKKKMSSAGVVAALLITGLASIANAQEAPAPRAMPRVPVARASVMEHHESAGVPRQIQGKALIIDGEKLRVADMDLRLFGIVPPQLAASYGPQARSALDNLTAGQDVTCQIRDRDRDGRLLATCAVGSNDLALELLKHGLAVTARGTLASSDLLSSYIAAEENAQNQKIGLWSVNVSAAPAPLSIPAPVASPMAIGPIAVPAAPAPTAIATTPPAPVVAAPFAIKDEKSVTHSDKVPAVSATATVPTATQLKIEQELQDQQNQARLDDSHGDDTHSVGFFERYQILLASLLMLATALAVLGMGWAHKRRDKRDETKSIAAALRGELMAARGICMGRIKNINSDDEDRAASWPRIRATLYTAYVSRLGLLGAELARQTASIYGQSSDFAAFFTPSNTASQGLPKKQALETLVRHIDEVMPKLATLEQYGSVKKMNIRHAGSTAIATSLSHRLPLATVLPVSDHQPNLVAFRTDVEEHAPAAELFPDETYPGQPTPMRSPLALWETVRGFIQNHRQAITQLPTEPSEPVMTDTEVSEYAAMIEADMARYHQSRTMANKAGTSPTKNSTKRGR